MFQREEPALSWRVYLLFWLLGEPDSFLSLDLVHTCVKVAFEVAFNAARR